MYINQIERGISKKMTIKELFDKNKGSIING